MFGKKRFVRNKSVRTKNDGGKLKGVNCDGEDLENCDGGRHMSCNWRTASLKRDSTEAHVETDHNTIFGRRKLYSWTLPVFALIWEKKLQFQVNLDPAVTDTVSVQLYKGVYKRFYPQFLLAFHEPSYCLGIDKSIISLSSVELSDWSSSPYTATVS